jgi:hypothetical protein
MLLLESRGIDVGKSTGPPGPMWLLSWWDRPFAESADTELSADICVPVTRFAIFWNASW